MHEINQRLHPHPPYCRPNDRQYYSIQLAQTVVNEFKLELVCEDKQVDELVALIKQASGMNPGIYVVDIVFRGARNESRHRYYLAMVRFHYLVWSDVVSHIVDMLIAYALALPIGWDREAATNGARVSEHSPS